MTEQTKVVHNEAENRFEIRSGDHLAVAEYDLEDDAIVFTHTIVPEELEGRGIAKELVRTGLEHARAKKLKVVPQCAFVASFIKRNPEYKELLRD